jgi:hypothetical protein
MPIDSTRREAYTEGGLRPAAILRRCLFQVLVKQPRAHGPHVAIGT